MADPFYKLEHEGEDTAKAKKQAPLLVRLQEAADMKHSDSYARNKALRAQLRVCLVFKPSINSYQSEIESFTNTDLDWRAHF